MCAFLFFPFHFIQPNVKDLGIVLDSGLTMCGCVSSVCHSAYLKLRRIGSIRPFLTVEAAVELARSHILSRIDYCSSLVAGITSEQLARLQKYKTTLPDRPSVRNVMTMSLLS